MLKSYISGQVTDSNFYLLFEGLSEGELKVRLSDLQTLICTREFPSPEAIKASVDKFDKIKHVAAQLKRVKLKRAEFNQPEAINLKRVKKEVSNS